MTRDEFQIDVAYHPILRPAAFTTVLPASLGELRVPSWLTDLLTLNGDVPFERSEDIRTAVRNMLRYWGHKPAGRGKPASEYLVRAVGRTELRSINLAVDLCNVVSLHSGMPIALIDLNRAEPPFHVAPGRPGESYEFNLSGQVMSLNGLICLHDARGPCANPVKDAQRTKTHDGTTQTLTVIWGVVGYEQQRDAAVTWYQTTLRELNAEVVVVPVKMESEP
ncbi:MAG: hypothetical protein A2289_18035 [Deltaproteobacteria bacterium RIFOXYA12_FULL_58_15]|nr:MAG: hypothetical protein A2289_18035 [Deltaproteobacteria bacterium RIFOXYA12_FULL_58_15]